MLFLNRTLLLADSSPMRFLSRLRLLLLFEILVLGLLKSHMDRRNEVATPLGRKLSSYVVSLDFWPNGSPHSSPLNTSPRCSEASRWIETAPPPQYPGKASREWSGGFRHWVLDGRGSHHNNQRA